LKQNNNEKPRVAASSYLNTAPLIWSFISGSRHGDVELLMDAAPAVCGDMLAKNEAEVALVPVIEYQRIPGLQVVPDVCVGSRERVRSVVLATRHKEMKDIRTISLDVSSRTSSVLVQIIFREFLGFEPECRPSVPDLGAMLDANDAALIIGDPAMVFPRDDLQVHDLAGLWRGYTGLGFVFAMWMVRESEVDKIRDIDFAGARDEGLAHIDEIIDHYHPKLDLPRDQLRTYLSENITFSLDREMRAGLELYFALAQKHEFILSNRPLKMA